MENSCPKILKTGHVSIFEKTSLFQVSTWFVHRFPTFQARRHSFNRVRKGMSLNRTESTAKSRNKKASELDTMRRHNFENENIFKVSLANETADEEDVVDWDSFGSGKGKGRSKSVVNYKALNAGLNAGKSGEKRVQLKQIVS